MSEIQGNRKYEPFFTERNAAICTVTIPTFKGVSRFLSQRMPDWGGLSWRDPVHIHYGSLMDE